MAQLSILKGIYIDAAANFDIQYPYNLEPVVTENGISNGYLRTAPGITQITQFTAVDRGAIWWRGICYRVMQSAFVTVIGNTVTQFGNIDGGTTPVSLDYSFDLLVVVANLKAWLTDGVDVNQILDTDLGPVIDVVWIDGYFVYTDREFIIVSELNDPYSINPLKYGSSEEDPDDVVGLRKVRGELWALNRYTIEVFQNVGGEGFPFQRVPSGLIAIGAVGTHAATYFLETLAFVGSGRNQELSVWIAGTGEAARISTPQIDRILASYNEEQQAAIEVESIVHQGEQRLFVHLPDKTLVYHHKASEVAGERVWTILAMGSGLDTAYPAKHFALAGNQFIGGSVDGRIGYLDETTDRVFGDQPSWQFDTAMTYNGGKGGIVKSLELVGAPGRNEAGPAATAAMRMSLDGTNYSAPYAISIGSQGQTRKRMQWRPKRRFTNYCTFRFNGNSGGVQSFARLEAEFEGLN